MQKKNTWLAVLLSVTLGLCLLGCVVFGLTMRFAPNLYQYSLENSSLKVGDSAPDFELTSLKGEVVRLSQFKGQPVLLTFGASWCPDCRVEAPLIQEAHEKYPKLVILLVDSKESRDVVQRFADEFGMTHPVLLDNEGKVVESYQVFAIPTELFIDAHGIIRAKLIERVTPDLLVEKLLLIKVGPLNGGSTSVDGRWIN